MSEPKGSETPKTDALLVRTKAMAADRADLIDHARSLEAALLSAEKERESWRDEALYNRTFREQVGVACDQRNAAELRAERLEAALREMPALIARDVAELPDRNSPEDWPDAMLVTGVELQHIVANHVDAALSEPTQREGE